ncbi:MAG: hypothetical protein ACE5FO_07340 [Parvularculaceae bacterium]
MKQLALTPCLRRAAERCVWFETPDRAAGDTARLAAYILTYGQAEDIAVLREQLDDDDIREALDAAPPGIFDPRSWAYWNLVAGRFDTPPLPTRRLP